MCRLFFFIFLCVSSFVVVSLSACQKDDDMHDLAGTVVLDLREHAVNGSRHIGLFAVTRDEYPCLNFFIEYSYTHDSSVRLVHFEGVKAPRVCLTAIGPAKALIDFGAMEEDEHQVEFLLNEEHFITTFHVSDEKVAVKQHTMNTEFLEFYELEMQRLSDEHVWGYIHKKSSEPGKKKEEFFGELWAAGAVEEEMDPANYGFFRVTEHTWYFFDHYQQYEPQNPFVFLFENDFKELANLADSYQEHFVIVLQSATGDYHHNQQ